MKGMGSTLKEHEARLISMPFLFGGQGFVGFVLITWRYFYFLPRMAAWAATSRATGTRNGEQLT